MLNSTLELVNRASLFLGERVNAMLIRELRQGLRSKVFLGVFLLLQGAMMFSMLLAVLASLNPYDSTSQEIADFFFWLTVLSPLLISLPLRGAVAVSNEVKSGSLELLFLTRLSAWTTVMGKWLGIIVQSLLVVTALLPYTIMRYYLGGIDLFAEIGLIIQALMFNCFLAAVLIAMSAFSGGWVKGSILLGTTTMAMMNAYGNEDFRKFLEDNVFSSWQGPVAAIGLWAVLIIFFLQLGAAKVAPPAENYTMRKRLLGLFFLVGLPGLLMAMGVPYFGAAIVSFVFSLMISLEAILEPTIPLRSVYHRAGNPLLGGVVRYLLSPGWASGIFFYLLVALFSSYLFWPVLRLLESAVISESTVTWMGGPKQLVEYGPRLGPIQATLLLFNLSAVFIFPLAITGLFRRSARCTPTFYLTINLSFAVIAVVLVVLGLVGYPDAGPFSLLLPHGQAISLMFGQGLDPRYQDLNLLYVAGGISALCWIICIARAIQEFRAISSGEIERAPEMAEPAPGQIPSLV